MTFDYSLIGYIAACCTTCSFIPQVVQTLRTRDTESISLGMYGLFVTGVSFWLVYGTITANTPIMVANFFTLALASVVLIMKIRNRKKDSTQNQETLTD